jgi:predicted O-methyltransferase YrrM
MMMAEQAFLDLSRLLRIREVLGPCYGSEDLCLLLYSLIRRERPKIVVELGVGLGVSTVWMGQAMRENGDDGHVYAIDDSRDWDAILALLRKREEKLAGIVNIEESVTHQDYLQQIIRSCELGPHITCRQATMSLDTNELLPESVCEFGAQPIDLLFSDFAHGPEAITKILSFFLPRMSECASIFIDSASTHLNSFLMLERLVTQLNSSKIPRGFLPAGSGRLQTELAEMVMQRQFRLMHLVERKQRTQNSTAWLRIEPVDWQPHPDALLHYGR